MKNKKTKTWKSIYNNHDNYSDYFINNSGNSAQEQNPPRQST